MSFQLRLEVLIEPMELALELFGNFLEIACSTSEAKEQGERLWSLGESEEPIYN